MAIKVKCSCGKVLVAPDDAAGRRAKCSVCGVKLVIPGGAAAAAPPAPVASIRPSARKPPPPVPPSPGTKRPPDTQEIQLTDDDLYVPNHPTPAEPPAASVPAHPSPLPKSYNEILADGRAGKRRTDEEGQDPDGQLGLLRIWAPRLVPVAALMVVLGLGWMVYAHLSAGKEMDAINDLVARGDLSDAIQSLKNYLPHAGGLQPRADALLRQLQLEEKMNTGLTLTTSQPVSSKDATLTLRQPRRAGAGNGQSIAITLTNTGSKPLTLSRRSFYLRGAKDIVPKIEESKLNRIPDGAVLPPGGTQEGVLVFGRMPVVAAPARGGAILGGADQFWLIYNDGDVYVKSLVDY
jgi:hypothetical protein